MSTREQDVLEATTPGQDRIARLRERLEQAAGPGAETGSTRFDRLRTRLQAAEEQAKPGTPTGDGDGPATGPSFMDRVLDVIGDPREGPVIRGEPSDPEAPNELIPTMRRAFSEERGRLGLGAETVRGFARVPGQFLEGAGGAVQAAAVNLRDPVIDVPEGSVFEELAPFSPEGRRKRFGRGEQLRRAGRALEDAGRESQEAFPASADVDRLDLTDLNALAAGGAEAIGQLGTQLVAAAATGGGSAVTQFLMFAGPTAALEGGGAFIETRDRLLDAGLDPQAAEAKAAGVAATTGMGAIALERIPAARFVFRRVPGAQRLFGARIAEAAAGRGGFITNVLTGAGAEASEEVLQEAWSSLIQDIQAHNPKAWEDIGPRLLAGGVFGAIGGAAGGAVVQGGSPPAPETDPGEAPSAPPEPAGVPGPPTAPPEPADVTGDSQGSRIQRLRRRLAEVVDPSVRDELQDAYRDQLTGVANRDAFQRARPNLDADPDTELVIADVVNLHGMNTILGGQANADEQLTAMVDELKAVAEDAGIDPRNVFRSGGDEFVIAAPKGTGQALARQIRRRVGTPQIADSEFSTGFRTGVGNTFRDADAAILEAKKGETAPRFRTPEGEVTPEADVAVQQPEDAGNRREEPADAGSEASTRPPAEPEDGFPVREAFRRERSDEPEWFTSRDDVLATAENLDFARNVLETGKNPETGRKLGKRQREQMEEEARQLQELLDAKLDHVDMTFGSTALRTLRGQIEDRSLARRRPSMEELQDIVSRQRDEAPEPEFLSVTPGDLFKLRPDAEDLLEKAGFHAGMRLRAVGEMEEDGSFEVETDSGARILVDATDVDTFGDLDQEAEGQGQLFEGLTDRQVELQAEAIDEVTIAMGGNVATAEQLAEIDRRYPVAEEAEEADDGGEGAQLEGAPQEESPQEPAEDVQGPVEDVEIEPPPPAGAPGGVRDVRETPARAGAEEPDVDAAAAPRDRGGDRAPGAHPREGRGDHGSREVGRVRGLDLRIGSGPDALDPDAIGAGGAITKTRANLEAIRTLKAIEAEGRPATLDEQRTLALYVGWGGIPQVFNQHHKRFGEFNAELRELLTDAEYRSAEDSTPNAHFTSIAVVQEIHAGLRRLGLPPDARVLEPSAGIGNFIGAGPTGYRWSAVELDSLTARMAKLIYPRQTVMERGYERLPGLENHFDAAVSNVPFGDYKVDDPEFRDMGFTIHNYFFAKAVHQVRPGGLIAFITSSFTMDAKSFSVRSYLSQRADLVGAIRLPNTAFRGNAGTEVTTDLIILRKRHPGPDPEFYPGTRTAAAWLGRSKIDTPQGETEINSFFADHPEFMLGRMELTGTLHGRSSPTLVAPDGQNLRGELRAALERLPEGIVGEREGPAAAAAVDIEIVGEDLQEGSFQLRGDAIMQVRGGQLVGAKVAKTQQANVRALAGLRDQARRVLQIQLQGDDTAAIEASQARLNELYDAYVRARGPIGKEKETKSGTILRPNYTPFKADPDAALVLALEVYDSETNTAEKAPIFRQRVVGVRREVTEVDRPADTLPLSLAERGRVDLAWMSELAGVPQADLVQELRGRIYMDPVLQRWVTEDEYLSGNVREKLLVARAAATAGNTYREEGTDPEVEVRANVAALEAVQPEDLAPSQIDVSIGSPWIPREVYEDFINEILETQGFNRVTIAHVESEALFTVEEGRRLSSTLATSTWGTERRPAPWLFEAALNQRGVDVYDTLTDGSRVKNVEQTMLAREKVQALKEKFRGWLWQREDAEALAREYNDRFNNIRVRQFDGSHLQPVGISEGITLRPHQLDAAWRIISGGNTLLAHVVGGGKTFTMQTAGMEQRRLGLVRKPMYVVPNHMLEQFTREFVQLYPTARILSAEKTDFSKSKRKALVARVATGDWDAVIVTHSAFKRIPVSRETQAVFLQEQLQVLDDSIRAAEAAGGETAVKKLAKARKRMEERLGRLLKAEEKDTGVTFEALGVDQVIVDEAHLFKNLYAPTKMEGVSMSDSQRASDLYMKIRYLEESVNPGRAVVFSTATPISNTMAEVYTMQRYLQLGLLRERGIEHFDAWAAQFGEAVTAAEIAPDGSGYRMKTRFARFRNLPELSQMFRQTWDVRRAKDLNLPTPRVRTKVIAAPASDELTDYVEELVQRSERLGSVDPSVDNMLKITGDGRKAALDMRLIDPSLDRDPDGKSATAAQGIYDVWLDTEAARSTQLVFIDFSTPKADGSFNVYDDVREQLLELGIPEGEIAYIHDANTDLQKAQLFAKVRAGEVRILFGSTEKMGIGTNVQTKLVALHHLDAPWRPADVEQRDGRGVRQGNENDEITLHRYVTEGSFDAYMWQGLERKQFFIEQVMSGDPSLRTAEDISGTSLNAAEVKALASGNPLAIEKAGVDAEVARLSRMQAAHADDQFKLRRKLARLPEQVEETEREREAAHADAEARIPTSGDAFRMQLGSAEYSERPKAAELLAERVALLRASPDVDEQKIGSFAGFDLVLQRRIVLDEVQVFMLLRGAGTYRAAVSDLTPQGYVRRLEALAERIDREAKGLATRVRELKRELEQVRGAVGQSFDRQEELDKALARQAEINAALKLDGSEEQQIARHDEGSAETFGEAGLTRRELEERGDAGLLDIRPLLDRRRNRDPIITSEIDEVEARFQAAKGIPRDTLLQRAIDGWERFTAAMRRSRPEINPDESTTMALNQDILRQFDSARDWSLAMAVHEIRKVTDPLTEPQVDLVTRNLVLPDILKDIEEGLYEGKEEFPFGYTSVEQIEADLARYQAAAAADEAVSTALTRRGEIARGLTQRLVKNELLPAAVLEDDRYYHRQVLKHFLAKDFHPVGHGGPDARVHQKGFQRARIGGGDFNTAYQESEVEWMSQGFEMLARLGTLERLQQLNDVKGALKKEAKALNESRTVEQLFEEHQAKGGSAADFKDPMLPFRIRIAFSNAGLAKLAEAGELTSEGGRFDDLIDQLTDGYEAWKADMADREPSDRTPFRFDHPDWWGFLSHVLEHDLNGSMQAATIFKTIRQREAFMRDTLGSRYIDPANAKELARRVAPPGYVVWQPERGNHFFLGLTVEERVLEAAMKDNRVLTREDVRQQLVMGGPKEQWIIPANLAQALDNVKPYPDVDAVDNLWRAAQASWKQWVLLNPYRFMKYNLNNMSGDADIAFAYDPAILKLSVQAAKDLAAFSRGNASPELQKELLEATRLGVLGSGLRVAEIPDINEAGAFQFLTSGKLNPGQKVVRKYWRSVRGFTDWRENILRLAADRHFRARLEADPEARIYAASRRSEIDAIASPRERAAKLARELIGDYGNISRGGVWLRRHLIPFYSWIEINAPRYYRLLKNARHEGQTAGRGRRTTVVAAAKGTKATISLMVKANVLFVLANLWNHLFFPDEEEELMRGRRQLHLILGRREDGTIRSLRLEGALSDALEWFNLQDYPSDIADLIAGRRDLLAQGAEFVKAPVERLLNSWEPFAKTVFEVAMGRSTFPTVFEEGGSFDFRTRPIRDRKEHVARVFSLDRLYRRVTGRPRPPSRGVANDLLDTMLLYSTDPGEAAYWQSKDLASDWLEEQGDMRADISPTRRSTALYYWKQAVKWGDDDAAVKWERRYRELGGSDRGMAQSLRMSAPLGAIAQARHAAFLSSLTPEERDIVDRAETWFGETYGSMAPPRGTRGTSRRQVRRRRR